MNEALCKLESLLANAAATPAALSAQQPLQRCADTATHDAGGPHGRVSGASFYSAAGAVPADP